MKRNHIREYKEYLEDRTNNLYFSLFDERQTKGISESNLTEALRRFGLHYHYSSDMERHAEDARDVGMAMGILLAGISGFEVALAYSYFTNTNSDTSRAELFGVGVLGMILSPYVMSKFVMGISYTHDFLSNVVYSSKHAYSSLRDRVSIKLKHQINPPSK